MENVLCITISEGYSHFRHLSSELMNYRDFLSSWDKFNIYFFMIAICYISLPLSCCFLVNPIIYMRKAIWRASFPSATHHPIYILTISDLWMASALSISRLHWHPLSWPPAWIYSLGEFEGKLSMEIKSNNGMINWASVPGVAPFKQWAFMQIHTLSRSFQRESYEMWEIWIFLVMLFTIPQSCFS